MNDERQQIQSAVFDRIVWGLAFIGLVGSLAAVGLGGFSSPWLLWAGTLLVATLVAFVLRRTGQFVVASYGLVLELIGLVAGIIWSGGTSTDFSPYLFIPIVIIAGLILNPLATIAAAILSISVTLGIVALAEQFTLANLSLLLPPFGLILFTTLLVGYINMLGRRLLKNKKGLHERAIKALKKAEEFEQRTTELEQALIQAQAEAGRMQEVITQRDSRLYRLIKGTIQELDTLAKGLEAVIESVEEMSGLRGPTERLEEAWRKIYHLANMVVNLEEMAQLDSNEVSLNYRSIDVERLINEVVGTARGLAREKNLELRYRVPEDLPKLQADPVRLRQALLHLLSNAVKYTDEGVVEVQAELTDSHELMIFISDTGIGMYREELELIFEKFGRGRGALAQQRQGPGLGLAISKRIIELHGGWMWVTSVLGVGSTFYITLPLAPESDKAPAALSDTVVASTAMLAVTPQPVSGPANSFEQKPAQPLPPPEETEVTLVSSRLVPEEQPISPPAGTTTSYDGDSSRLMSPLVPAIPAVKPYVGSSFARFGSTMMKRFALILGGLLLLIVSLVAVLAILNGPEGHEEVVAEELTPVSKAVVDLPAAQTPLPRATATLPPTTTPVITVPPSATSTPRPTETPTPAPTDTPVVVKATPTATFTPTPTRVSSPSPSPSPTPTPSPTVTAEPDQVTAIPAALVVPTPVPPRRLSFVVERNGQQLVSVYNFEDEPGADLAVAVATVNNTGLSWSRLGQLLFTTDRDGDREIYLAQADGSPPLRLTQADGDDTQPAWSPDGRKIAFSSGRNGNFDIYLMNADGSDLVQLTTGRGFDEWPVWSPDGSKIAFVSDQAGNVEIYTIKADGTDQQQLTHHPADDWPATWSPDSSKLVFSSNRDSNWNLYMVDADGGNLLRLTDDPANEREPAWSPDGRILAFAYDGAGNWDIYTIPTPSGWPAESPRQAWTQITDTPTDERYPLWLP